jgi:hypothetical protein
MIQTDAFLPPIHPRARNTDPRSSHDAAARVERNGNAKASAQRVLAGLKRYPMATSAELAKAAGLDRAECARRLPELAEVNAADRYDPTPETMPCAVTGIRCVRWCAR